MIYKQPGTETWKSLGTCRCFSSLLLSLCQVLFLFVRTAGSQTHVLTELLALQRFLIQEVFSLIIYWQEDTPFSVLLKDENLNRIEIVYLVYSILFLVQ